MRLWPVPLDPSYPGLQRRSRTKVRNSHLPAATHPSLLSLESPHPRKGEYLVAPWDLVVPWPFGQRVDQGLGAPDQSTELRAHLSFRPLSAGFFLDHRSRRGLVGPCWPGIVLLRGLPLEALTVVLGGLPCRRSRSLCPVLGPRRFQVVLDLVA